MFLTMEEPIHPITPQCCIDMVPLRPSSARKKRVLVVEDLHSIRNILVTILELDGYEAVWAVNGRQALEKLQLQHCDLVLMDYRLQDMDGFQATALIRDPASCVVSPGVPIIMVSGYGHDGILAECIAMGMNDYLAKPFSGDQLLGMVHRWARAGH